MLLVVQNMRAQAAVMNIDPRIVRIALKYALMVDDYLSKQLGLTEQVDQQLTKEAAKLFKQTLKISKQKGESIDEYPQTS